MNSNAWWFDFQICRSGSGVRSLVSLINSTQPVLINTCIFHDHLNLSDVKLKSKVRQNSAHMKGVFWLFAISVHLHKLCASGWREKSLMFWLCVQWSLFNILFILFMEGVAFRLPLFSLWDLFEQNESVWTTLYNVNQKCKIVILLDFSIEVQLHLQRHTNLKNLLFGNHENISDWHEASP